MIMLMQPIDAFPTIVNLFNVHRVPLWAIKTQVMLHKKGSCYLLVIKDIKTPYLGSSAWLIRVTTSCKW